MAKKIYNIPLSKVQVFIKEHRTVLNKILSNKQYLEYVKRFGKSYYDQEIESFITFFKIDKDIPYALKTVNYLSSNSFYEEIFALLNFSQFDFDKYKIAQRDFFYGFCYVLKKRDDELLKTLLAKLFLHFHSSQNENSNININFKEMTKALAKTNKLLIKESFGEDENSWYFKIFVDGKDFIELRGKSIKTLRKKAYRKLFYHLLDF